MVSLSMEAASVCDERCRFVCHHSFVKQIPLTCMGPWYTMVQEESIGASHGLYERTKYIVYRRRQKQWGCVEWWHGTTLDVAIAILTRGFCVGPSTDRGYTGAFGIIYDKDEVDARYHSQCDDICKRLCLDRVKIYYTDKFRTCSPEEACPCIIHAWVPQCRRLHAYKRFPCHRKAVIRGGISSMLEVHIPVQTFVRFSQLSIHAIISGEVRLCHQDPQYPTAITLGFTCGRCCERSTSSQVYLCHACFWWERLYESPYSI